MFAAAAARSAFLRSRAALPKLRIRRSFATTPDLHPPNNNNVQRRAKGFDITLYMAAAAGLGAAAIFYAPNNQDVDDLESQSAAFNEILCDGLSCDYDSTFPGHEYQ